MIGMNERHCANILTAAQKKRVLVIGDVMLDQFVFGNVSRISPEAPVPIVNLEQESYMPGGSANVACNLGRLGVKTTLIGIIGRDRAGKELTKLLGSAGVKVQGMVSSSKRKTALKTRIASGQQQIVRLDSETRGPLCTSDSEALARRVEVELDRADAVIVGDYAKGVVTQMLLDALRSGCKKRGLWLSLDPKPSHPLDLRGLSLLTPNRKEAFQLAGELDSTRAVPPLRDSQLLRVAERLMGKIKPAVLLVTLSEHGMLLCADGRPPLHIPTVSREVFDVSGAGDTVIASFTLAVAAGASPAEAAVISNHAAGVVVGKFGTATVSPKELRESFRYPVSQGIMSDASR